MGGLQDQVHVPSKIGEKMSGRSGMQTLSRGSQVEAALRYLAPFVVNEDPDGVTVYFFDSRFSEHPHMCSDKDVVNLFHRNSPGGGTYLSSVLREAMEPDTIGRAEAIFILTDGSASDRVDTSR